MYNGVAIDPIEHISTFPTGTPIFADPVAPEMLGRFNPS